MNNPSDRRRFLNLCAGALAVSFVTESKSADLPHLAPADPTASALGYVADAGKLDPQQTPQHKAGQRCANCKQFTAQADSEYGACLIFSGKSVHQNGWCAAYVAKT